MEISNQSLGGADYNINMPMQGKPAIEPSSAPNMQPAAEKGVFLNAQVTDIVGEKIVLLLGDGSEINAKLDGKFNINIQDNILFQVLESDDNKIRLRAVSSYDPKESLLLNALKESGLSLSDRNLGVAGALLEQGEPLNKETFTKIFQGLTNSPTADIKDLINLNKHGIALTKENIEGFNNYKEAAGAIKENVKNFEAQINKLFNEVTSESTPEVSKIVSKLLEVFSDKAVTAEPEEASKGQISYGENNEPVSDTSNKSDTQPAKEFDISTPEKAELKEALSRVITNIKENFIKDGLQEKITSGDGFKNLEMLSSKDGSAADALKELSSLIKNLSDNKDTQEVLAKLYKSKDFSELIKEIVHSRYSLNEKAVESLGKGDDTELKKLYNRIISDSTRLSEALSDTNLGKELGSTMGNMKDNLSFMNSLNDIMPFIQIPVALNSSEFEGELYVFANKKQKMVKSDTLSAHLHLTLEHLGATDVHITLNGNNTNTKFTLADDESAALVERHMPELIKRLEDKGYNVSYSVTSSDETEKVSPLDVILKQEAKTDTLKRYSFDIRA